MKVLRDGVPVDLDAPEFLAGLVNAVLERTPIEMHVAVRELRDQRDLALAESDTGEIKSPEEAAWAEREPGVFGRSDDDSAD